MKYFQTRDKMIEWDIKRMSESIAIVNLTQPSKKPGYTFDLIVNNTGGVLVKIVRIYIYDNKTGNLNIFDEQKDLSGVGFINGIIMPGEGGHVISVKAENDLNSTTLYRYRIVVCTERGRQFSFSYPPPPPIVIELPGGVGAYYALILTNKDSFQYMDQTNAANYFKSAYVKPRSSNNPLYRICINNTTNKKVILLNNCTMLQMYGAAGQITPRYIVSNTTTIWDQNPRKFTSQTINPYSAQYLYFAGSSIDNPGWVADPNNKGYYIVGFLICFRYEGETTVRTISLPALIQQLT
jgi:PKD repeat protein